MWYLCYYIISISFSVVVFITINVIDERNKAIQATNPLLISCIVSLIPVINVLICAIGLYWYKHSIIKMIFGNKDDKDSWI